MTVSQALLEALEAFRHNKLRTFLTVLGMVIGTASVTTVLAAGAMIRKEFLESADAIGGRLIIIQRNWETVDYEARAAFMSNRDVEELKALRPKVSFVRRFSQGMTVSRGGSARELQVLGCDEGYFGIMPKAIKEGRLLDGADGAAASKVALVSSDVADFLFPERSAVGGFVMIGPFEYSVVGVVEKPPKTGMISDGSDRDCVFVPYATLERMTDWTWAGSPRVYAVMAKAPSVESVQDAADAADDYLRRTYGEIGGKPRFSVRALESSLSSIRAVFGAVSAVVAFIAGISLLVSGVGIMNVMLVTVSERTSEIGLRKAIGARSSEILGQFLAEAVLICVAGGAIGLALGAFASLAVSKGLNWDLVFPWTAPAFAAAVSVATGLVFGVAPAKGAAGMDPVVALSKE